MRISLTNVSEVAEGEDAGSRHSSYSFFTALLNRGSNVSSRGVQKFSPKSESNNLR